MSHQAKACRFVFKGQGCMHGDACEFSHDPAVVNARYNPPYPLRYCSTPGCTQVSTFDLCKGCYYAVQQQTSSAGDSVAMDTTAESSSTTTLDTPPEVVPPPVTPEELYPCQGYKCTNQTKARYCRACQDVEARYVVRRSYTSQFSRR